ncbi:helix-turn-helix transcriptional regulator [Companilactobacillus kedongensis]|uniref:helix-turn-helix transcriptional regulator n=1 Tax=Companilactobacillus kedongensis TaxID=2486004 RepID=UPI000F77E7E1|nr:AraC family transcriptional regulator [Companilactobacillus kedongensis]
MEEFDLNALLSSKEKMLIRLLQSYAISNNIVICILDNNSLVVKTVGDTSGSDVLPLLNEKFNLSNIKSHKLLYHIEYADRPIMINEINQIVGKVAAIFPVNTTGKDNVLIYNELKRHCVFLKNLIENVSQLIIDNSGIDSFIMKYPLKVEDIIDGLDENEATALQQLSNLSTSNEAIISAIEFIDNNLDKRLTLDRVAKSVYLSDFYFSKLFKKETKLSFSVYLNARKIQQAMLLLKETDLSINDVSKRLGFRRMSYFSQTFKKYTGVAPSRFRNKKN